MTKRKKRDASAIFKETMELNNLNYKDIVSICERSESTVFKWMNGSLTPDGLSLLQLHQAIFDARLKMPRELDRVKGALLCGARGWAKNNRGEKLEMVGEKKRDRKEAAQFMYKGELLTRQEIASRTGSKYITVYQRTKHTKYKTDVTDVVERKKWQ